VPRHVAPFIACVVVLTSSAAAQSKRSIPDGFMNATVSETLRQAWTGKSLWIPNPPFLGGGTCFEFHAWTDCEIFSFDGDMTMRDKDGRLCEVKEYRVVDSPGMQSGDFGLIVTGIGTSVNYGFPRVIVPGDTVFTPRNGNEPWEISDASCAVRVQ